MEKAKIRRLTLWAIIMIVLAILSVSLLGIDEATVLIEFFKEIIIHLLVA
jgi:hypothetical protein